MASHYSVYDLSLSAITALENIGFELFADFSGFKNPETFFNLPRPDIVVKNGNKLTVVELPCCYETNL